MRFDDIPEEAPSEADDIDDAEADGEDPGLAPESGEPAPQPEGEETPAAPPPAEEPAAQAPPKSEDVPESNTINVNGARPSPRTADELHAENAEIAQDIALGHIQPKTIQSLYDSKDTLGKIGTLFGLLVSGMGSGLTGQPNAVLEMMNNIIKNDLEAQVKSSEGARNWYQMSLQHEMNRANIKRLGVENEYTRGKTGQIPAETARIEAATTTEKARAKHEEASAKLVAMNSALVSARLGMLKSLEGTAEGMPPGPTKAAAENALTTQVVPAVNAANEQDTNATADKIKLNAALHGQPQPGAGRVDMSKIRSMTMLGGAQQSIGGFNTKGFKPEEGARAAQEGAFINGNRNNYDIVTKTFEDLDKHAFGGKINDGYYNTKLNDMVKALASSGLSEKEVYGIAQASLPGPNDWGEARAEKAQHMRNVFLTNENGKAPTLSQIPGMVPTFPPPPKLTKSVADQGTINAVIGGAKKLLQGGEGEAKGAEGETKMIKGAKYRKVQGGWQKVK